MGQAPTAEQLLADASWLRRLAERLAGDGEADDLVQETWIAAWQRQPDTERPLRPWLAKVMRDTFRMRRRAERRRQQRELSVDEAAPEVSPADLLEQVRLHKLLVELVLAMDEPFRSTLLLRFVEGRTAAEIARATGVPEGTVRWRLHEALSRLRTRLDEINGSRKAWAPAVLVFAEKGMVVAKTTKSVIAIVMLLILLMSGAALVWFPSTNKHTPDEGATLVASATSGGSAREPGALSGSRQLPTWFASEGAPARKIAGRVTFRGVPVAGATVALHTLISDLDGGGPTLQMATTSDGSFDFGVLPASQYSVTASTADTVASMVYIDTANPVLRPPPDHLELRLGECAGRISGTVFDASGNPLPRVHVRRDLLVGVDTDATGTYALCVPIGFNEIGYSADGYGAVTLTVDARGEVVRDLVLVPEATIVIRVVRADDARPVPNARIMVRPSQWSADHPSVKGGISDDEGRVHISGLVPGRYRALGFADGLQSTAQVEVSAEIGTVAEEILRMQPMARLTGRVMNGTTPVVGAKVVAVRNAPTMRSASAFSQEDGRFVLERVPPGKVTFLASPYDVASPASLNVELGKRYDDVILDVRALASIRGRVTRQGKPVGGAEVCCVRTAEAIEDRVRADADGRYEFDGVVAGSYSLMAESADAFNMPTKINVGPREERVLDLELDLAASIAGTVVDRAGHPVKGVVVRWRDEKTGDVGRCTTDSQGRYRCVAMSGDGTYSSAVFPSFDMQTPFPTADGGPYPVRELKDGSSSIQDVRIAIDQPQLTISGRVLDDAGVPVADAVVKARAVRDGELPLFHAWERLPMTATTVDGEFTVRGLAPGRYGLQAERADGGAGTIASVAAGTFDITIRIERPARIEGTLVDFQQPPVVYARRVGEFAFAPGVVRNTAFTVSGLKPGTYIVNAQTAQEGDAKRVELHAGESVKLTLVSQGRGAIEGAVLDFKTRAPISNATCHAVMSVAGEQTMTSWDPSTAPRSDSRGVLLIDPAPAGTVTVSCLMPTSTWSPASAEVVVIAGRRARVELLSVEAVGEARGSIGAVFDHKVTPPRISQVVPNSSGAKAGLRVGDLVVEVNGSSVAGLNGMGVATLIENTSIGKDVTLTVLRGGGRRTLAAKIEPRAL